jgi:hypothetical protein
MALAKSQANPIWRMPMQARSAALAGATSMLRGDAELMAQNPASLAGADGDLFGMGYTHWLQDIALLNLLWGHAWGEGGFALNLQNLSSTEPRRDWDGENQGTFQNSIWNGGIGTAQSFGGVSFGLAGKFATESYGGDTSFSLLFDYGVQTRLLDGRLLLGAAFQNFGQYYWLDDSEALATPRLARTGVGLALVESVCVMEELRYEPDSRVLSHAFALEATQRWALLGASLRVGFDSSFYGLGLPAGMNLGAGLQLGGWNLNYQWAPMGALGSAHRIGLVFRETLHETWGQPSFVFTPQEAPAP